MLELLKQWAMTLAGVVIFGSLCEVILPEGSFQKYIRLAVGLLLVFTLIAPLRQFLQLDFSGTELFDSGTQAYLQREEMEEQQKNDVIRIYIQNLNQKMKQSLQTELGETDLEVHCQVEESAENFGNIREVLVLLRTNRDESASAEIKKILQREYGVNEKRITVRYLKERDE